LGGAAKNGAETARVDPGVALAIIPSRQERKHMHEFGQRHSRPAKMFECFDNHHLLLSLQDLHDDMWESYYSIVSLSHVDPG
jgi:hypothetical protein